VAKNFVPLTFDSMMDIVSFNVVDRRLIEVAIGKSIFFLSIKWERSDGGETHFDFLDCAWRPTPPA
jgi:hypothetical protein